MAAVLQNDGALLTEAQAQALLARIRANDSQALGQLYDACVDRVYSIALRVLGENADAEEAVADVFTQVWQRADRYDPARGGVAAWLSMLAHSRAIDRRRRRGEGLTLVRGDEAESLLALESSEAMSGFDLVDALQQSSALRTALAGLNPAQRRLIGLAYVQGLSHSEIAQCTGIALGTVKSRLRLGLEQLRRVLGAELTP